MNLISAIIQIVTSFLLRAAEFFVAFSYGRTVEKNKHNKKVIENVKKADMARNDTSNDNKLRDKYK